MGPIPCKSRDQPVVVLALIGVKLQLLPIQWKLYCVRRLDLGKQSPPMHLDGVLYLIEV